MIIASVINIIAILIWISFIGSGAYLMHTGKKLGDKEKREKGRRTVTTGCVFWCFIIQFQSLLDYQEDSNE